MLSRANEVAIKQAAKTLCLGLHQSNPLSGNLLKVDNSNNNEVIKLEDTKTTNLAMSDDV